MTRSIWVSTSAAPGSLKGCRKSQRLRRAFSCLRAEDVLPAADAHCAKDKALSCKYCIPFPQNLPKEGLLHIVQQPAIALVVLLRHQGKYCTRSLRDFQACCKLEPFATRPLLVLHMAALALSSTVIWHSDAVWRREQHL